MKVYGHPISTCTRKVLTTIIEKGHDPELVVIDLFKGEHKQPEHLARQPFGVVPAIDDDGFVLYESRPIIRYVDERLSGPSLTPGDLRAKACMEQWMGVEQSYFTPAAMKIIYNRMFHPMMGKETDEAVVAQASGEVAKVLDITEKTLANQEYLAPSGFSLADISWMPYVQYLFASKAGALITERPGVAAWWQRVSTRPSWKRVAA